MKYAVLTLGLAAALLGCRHEERVGTTQTTSATMTKPTLSENDRAFVAKATQIGMLEVALGDHVTREATAADVRAFGEQMVVDHSLAEEELRSLAATKGVNVPRELDADHRATFDKLAKLEGKKLDRQYADDIVEDNEQDVKELEAAARDLDDPELRAWAAKRLPTLREHLEKSKALKAKLR